MCKYRCQILGGLRLIEESHCEARVLVWFFLALIYRPARVVGSAPKLQGFKVHVRYFIFWCCFYSSSSKNYFSEGEMRVTGGSETFKNLKMRWHLPLGPPVDVRWIVGICGATTRFITSHKCIQFNLWTFIHHETHFCRRYLDSKSEMTTKQISYRITGAILTCTLLGSLYRGIAAFN